MVNKSIGLLAGIAILLFLQSCSVQKSTESESKSLQNSIESYILAGNCGIFGEGNGCPVPENDKLDKEDTGEALFCMKCENREDKSKCLKEFCASGVAACCKML